MKINTYNKYNGILKDNQELLIDPFLSSQEPFRITLKELREFIEDNLTISPGGTETDPIWTADKPNYLTSASASATYALLGHTHTFASLTSKPTTLSGYGIIDAYPLVGNPSGFLTSFSETDPIYSASSWFSTTNNSANWNTAFGWGNHASAGYLTTEHTGYNLKTTGATIGAGLTVYYDAYGTSTFSASETTKASINQYTGTIKSIYVYNNSGQPVSGSLVITVRQSLGGAFSDTTATLTIAAGSVAGIYSATGLSASITAGSVLTIKTVNNATGASAQIFGIALLIEHI